MLYADAGPACVFLCFACHSYCSCSNIAICFLHAINLSVVDWFSDESPSDSLEKVTHL